jgi:hypothetical protein
MPFLKFCEQCQTEVVVCEHIAHEQKPQQTKIEGDLESEPQSISEDLIYLWGIVFAEDLAERDGRPYHPLSRDRYQAAVSKFERLQEKHHELTRQHDCNCNLCRRNGWYLSLVDPSKPKKSALAAFLDGDEGDDRKCHCGCCCQGCRRGGCGAAGGWECICDLCMEGYESRTLGRRFYVIDGVGAAVVRNEELEEFLAEYPCAREVK